MKWATFVGVLGASFVGKSDAFWGIGVNSNNNHCESPCVPGEESICMMEKPSVSTERT
jgi:hypothetical protein